MKKLVYLFLSVVVGFGNINNANAQTATFLASTGSSDTAMDFMRLPNTDVDVNNPLKSASGNPVYIRTTVTAKSVPAGVTAQFCDNNLCTNANIGSVYRSHAYTSAFALYHAPFLDMNSAPANSVAYLTVHAEDTVSGYNRYFTFIAYKPALGVTQTTVVSGDDVTVFPNPARDAVNVLYNENAGVKKIAIYNLIGKMMKAFIPMDNNSAKLDIDNIPTGVYFIRLMDAQSHVLATRRFTRQ